MWGGVFSSVDCMLISYRQKDDPWNAIAAGYITGGVLAIRGGISVANKNALMGGVILALIEGVSVIVTSFTMRQQHAYAAEEQKKQLAQYKAMMKKGGNPDPSTLDYNFEASKQDAPQQAKAETLIDRAKQFSF